jgi:hypothetical protein
MHTQIDFAEGLLGTFDHCRNHQRQRFTNQFAVSVSQPAAARLIRVVLFESLNPASSITLFISTFEL